MVKPTLKFSPYGEVPERPKGRDSKSRRGVSPSWVQIPPSPFGDKGFGWKLK
jgi:hypothetical protein